MSVIRHDFIEVKAEVSPEGWIRDNPIITRAGIFVYRKPDGQQVRELRPEAEVFKQDSLASLAGIPITDGHKGLVTKDNPTHIIGTVLAPGIKSDSNVTASIIIHNTHKIGSKRELSLGYRCDVDETPGEFNGESYHAIQKNIFYNHLAVIVKGRSGNARLRLDADDAVGGDFEQLEDIPMPDPKLVTVRVDEIDYQASPEIANALRRGDERLADLKRRFDAIEAERDGFKAKDDKHQSEVDKIRREAREEVRARIQLEHKLQQLELKFDEADDLIELKRKALAKLASAIKLDGKSDEYVNSAFDLALSMEDDKNEKLSRQKQRMDSKKGTPDVPVSAEAARANMIKRLRDPDNKQQVA